MVFSSLPSYLDPANWQQQLDHQIGASNANPDHQLHICAPTLPCAPPPPLSQPHVGGGTGSIRPGSMAERARLANIQMPEGALKCPRCESTNTKFCYFNNYSLSQPRHFCKTCRRYWTRGGALRSVPVGGGCRRNKRSKATNSKSPAASTDRQTTSTNSTSTTISSNSGAANILGLTSQLSPLSFMTPLGQLTDHYSTSGDISMNYTGLSAPLVGTTEMNFQIGSNLLGAAHGTGTTTTTGAVGIGGCGVASLLSSGGAIEQWRIQQGHQYPFLNTGLDPSPGLYQFHGGVEQSGLVGEPSQLRPPTKFSTSMFTQLTSVKVEDNNQQSNMSRQFLGNITGNNDHHHHHQWNNNVTAWPDLSGFSSSSTSNPL